MKLSLQKFSSDRCNNKAVYTSKTELFSFLHLLDTNPVIQQFLQYDNLFRLADKYLIAMVFIYFKRAQLNPEEYTYLNFFAGLCLAQSMEEDMELGSEIYSWALGTNEVNEHLPKLIELKILLWQAMDYRAAVSHHCCKQLISISRNHPIWKRERLTSTAQISSIAKGFYGTLTEEKSDIDEKNMKNNEKNKNKYKSK